MVRANHSVLWEYFEKLGDTKRATCQLCEDILSFATTTGNLKSHLKSRHPRAYVEVSKAQKRARLGERASSVTSSDEEPATITVVRTPTRIQSEDSRRFSLSEKRQKLSSETVGNTKGNRLIEELTEEKISATNLQKELIQKEIEEKKLKISLLQEEMKHRQIVFDIEKQDILHRKEEMEHKKQRNELERQEMLLRIQILKANLNNLKPQT